MVRAMMLSVSLLGLGFGPALAVSPAVTTDTSPPISGGGTSGAGTLNGGTLGGGAGMSGMRPMHGQSKMTEPRAPRATAEGIDANPNRDYRGGAGSPASAKAANTNAANTRSQIAPRLPDPDAESNSPEAYLIAARRALSRGQTGAAQEALERAETRALTRSTEPSLADAPDSKPLVQQISTARQALANRDMPGAQSAISDALADGGRVGRGPETRANGVPR